ncbi:MAG: right-handed parallel beta-helix repeat-containing protein [Deltaproteobacteria bacterium]|nr:right-handed parallel beta-helix repeat-containing protein [Deltaproteobacteria bacterium]
MCKLGSYLFLLTILLLMPGLAVATDHSGPIPTDEIWDPGDNPHIIVDNVTVPSGVTLTIMPGVEVRFNGNKYIYVDGAVNAPGISSNKITFTRNTATNGRGLYFYAGSVGDFTHCIMEHCYYGVRGNSTAAVSLSNCVLQKNTYGFYGDQCAPTLGTNTFQGNGTGLYLKTVTLFSVSSQVIEDNDTGIHFYYCTKPEVDATNTITHNKIYGVRFEDCSLPEIYADVTDGGTGIYFESCTNVGIIDNVTLKDNIGPYGALYMRDSGIFTLGTNNTITGNSWPLSIGAGSFPDTSSAIPSSGNTTNAIKVTGGSSNKTGVWPKFSAIPYIVTGNLTINTPGALTIEEGVEARISSEKYIYIKSALTASGTSDNPITFTRQSGSQWGGLRFYNGSISTLSHCTIEYATNGIYADSDPDISLANCAFQYNDTGIYFYLCTSPTPIVDSTNTIRDNKTYGIRFYNCSSPDIDVHADIANSGTGIRFNNCSDLGTIDNVALIDNTVCAIEVKNSGPFTLGPGNTITGNSWPLSIDAGAFPDASSDIPASGNMTNAIRVVSGTSNLTGTWPDFNLDYVVNNTPTIGVSGSLTIEPGVTIGFNTNQNMTTYGSLIASGDSGCREITFTRYDADSWSGLYFYSESAGTLERCRIEYAQYGVRTSNASPGISHSTLKSNTYGVYCQSNASPEIKGCKMTLNDYGVYSISDSEPIISGDSAGVNIISGNKTYGVYNADSTVAINAQYNYWGNASGPSHPTSNPDGRGDWVSDYVNYDPFVNYDFSACEGDFDLDGDVDGSDLAVFAADFGRTDCDTGEKCEGNFDCDNDVVGSDLAVFAANFGRTDCPK